MVPFRQLFLLRVSRRCLHLYLQAHFICFLNQLVMVHGGCDYLGKLAHMHYVTGHTHSDWLDCFTKVFFAKSSYLPISERISHESFPLYGIAGKFESLVVCLHDHQIKLCQYFLLTYMYKYIVILYRTTKFKNLKLHLQKQFGTQPPNLIMASISGCAVFQTQGLL